MKLKTCRTCEVPKPLRQFYRAGAHWHRGECKECKRVASQENYRLKREQVLAQRRAYRATPQGQAVRLAYVQSERGRRVREEAQRFCNAMRRMESAA